MKKFDLLFESYMDLFDQMSKDRFSEYDDIIADFVMSKYYKKFKKLLENELAKVKPKNALLKDVTFDFDESQDMDENGKWSAMWVSDDDPSVIHVNLQPIADWIKDNGLDDESFMEGFNGYYMFNGDGEHVVQHECAHVIDQKSNVGRKGYGSHDHIFKKILKQLDEVEPKLNQHPTSFIETYKTILESIDTRRQGLQKIDQMNTKKFLDFLREILPLFKENELDLDKVTITEKPDGSAIRLIVKDGELLFESSYSGVVTWDRMPFPEQGKWMKENLESKLVSIAKKIGFDFKIIGELIWCDQLVENEKVTPVGASYLAKNFGEKGGIIIIDLKKIVDDELSDLEDDEFESLTNLIKSICDSDFNFYSKQQDMKFAKSISLSFDTDQLIAMLQLPEYNKPRYTVKDQAIIDEVEKIKTEFLDQLEEIMNSTTGHFSAEGDLIEGLVLTVLDSGNEYGVFSRGYKAMKSNYNHYEADAEIKINDMLSYIFGYQIMSKIRQTYDASKYDEYEAKFNEIWPQFKMEYNSLYEDLKNDSSIPLATKSAQLSILGKKNFNYQSIDAFDDLLAFYKIGEQK